MKELGKAYRGCLWISSYNCRWIHNYLEIQRLIKNILSLSAGFPWNERNKVWAYDVIWLEVDKLVRKDSEPNYCLQKQVYEAGTHPRPPSVARRKRFVSKWITSKAKWSPFRGMTCVEQLWVTKAFLKSRNTNSRALAYMVQPMQLVKVVKGQKCNEKQRENPHAGLSSESLSSVAEAGPHSRRAGGLGSLSKALLLVAQWFLDSIPFTPEFLPVNFSHPSKNHPSFFPSLFVTQRTWYFTENPSRAWSRVLSLWFQNSATALLSYAARHSLNFHPQINSSRKLLQLPWAFCGETLSGFFLLSPFLLLLLSLLPFPLPLPLLLLFPGRRRFLCAWGDWLNFTWAKL